MISMMKMIEVASITVAAVLVTAGVAMVALCVVTRTYFRDME